MYGGSNIDYEAEGVAPPSHEVVEERIPFNVGGSWYQKGNYIYREGDELQCASKIPYGYILMGTDDNGLPILEKIKL